MTDKPAATMSLADLKPGQSASILAITSDGPLGQRLMALGLIEGTAITVTRRALGGDPIEIEIMGYALSLRRDEARRIEIVLIDG